MPTTAMHQQKTALANKKENGTMRNGIAHHGWQDKKCQ